MKEIRLTKDKVAIIDDEDYEKVIKHTWSYKKNCNNDNNHYAICRKTRIFLHRLIMNLSDPNLVVDHINGDGLDNRKLNLRITTNDKNCSHRINPNKNNSSNYRGVHLDSESGYWGVQVGFENKRYFLGYFTDLKLAAFVYDLKAKELFGEFCGLLNFPEITKKEYAIFIKKFDKYNKQIRPMKNNKSGFRGVYFRKSKNKWRSIISHNNVTYEIGAYDNKEEAARAYDKKALELRGSKAKLNFPLV